MEKKTMDKVKNSCIILVLFVLFTMPVFAFADEDDLIVEFTPDPLFGAVNFLPGNSAEGSATVINNTGEEQDIIIEAINVSDPSGFSHALDLLIEEGEDTLFDDTLAAFFSAGEVSLSSLAGEGAVTTYDFTVTFDTATSSYQEKAVGFDVLIGFEGDEGGGGGGGGGGDGDGNGGGGGGGGGIMGLSIHDQSATTTSVGSTTATVTWVTSYKSTSRVIYDTLTGVFDFSDPPNYGYAFSTAEFNTPASTSGVVTHSVTITGLAPGTTYFYRTISHASPDTISREKRFATRLPDTESLPVVAALPPGATNISLHAQGVSPGDVGIDVDVEEAASEETLSDMPVNGEMPGEELIEDGSAQENDSAGVAATFFGINTTALFFGIGLLIVMLLIVLYRRVAR